MLVWRIETMDGSGPYRGSAAGKYRNCFNRLGLDWNCLNGCKPDAKWASLETILQPSLHFGFDSVERLCSWWHIPELRMEMYQYAGLRTIMYDAVEVVKTNNQLVFNKESARMLASYSFIG